MPTDCPFCAPPPGDITLENDRCWFLQTPQPVLEGSGIVVPKAHRPTAFDLTPDEWAATYDLLHQARALLDERYAPDGYTLGWNVEAEAGQHVFHAHLHVIPRFGDEPHAGKGLRYWLKQPENMRPSR